MNHVIPWLVCGVAAGYLAYRDISYPRRPEFGDYAIGTLCAITGYCALAVMVYWVSFGKLEKKLQHRRKK